MLQTRYAVQDNIVKGTQCHKKEWPRTVRTLKELIHYLLMEREINFAKCMNAKDMMLTTSIVAEEVQKQFIKHRR